MKQPITWQLSVGPISETNTFHIIFYKSSVEFSFTVNVIGTEFKQSLLIERGRVVEWNINSVLLAIQTCNQNQLSLSTQPKLAPASRDLPCVKSALYKNSITLMMPMIQLLVHLQGTITAHFLIMEIQYRCFSNACQ